MRRLIMLATGALAVLACTAAPATAGPTHHADENLCSGWEAAGAGVFDSLGSLAAGDAAARTAGGIVKEPNLSATYEAMPASAKGKGGPKFRASVPVWIHVVSDGATGNVSQSVIDKQMTALNLAFAASSAARSRVSRSLSPASPARTTRPGTTPAPAATQSGT